MRFANAFLNSQTFLFRPSAYILSHPPQRHTIWSAKYFHLRFSPRFPPPITFLPASILDRDAHLLGKLLRHLSSSPGLCHGERLVLGAVFQHMPLLGNDLGHLLNSPPLPGSSDTDDSKSFQCPHIFYDRILRLPIE